VAVEGHRRPGLPAGETLPGGEAVGGCQPMLDGADRPAAADRAGITCARSCVTSGPASTWRIDEPGSSGGRHQLAPARSSCIAERLRPAQSC
jgi:hypothetical protein